MRSVELLVERWSSFTVPAIFLEANGLHGRHMNPFGIPPEYWWLLRFLSRLLAATMAVSLSVLLADISAQIVPSLYAGITYVVVGATNWVFYYWMGCKILRRFGLMPA